MFLLMDWRNCLPDLPCSQGITSLLWQQYRKHNSVGCMQELKQAGRDGAKWALRVSSLVCWAGHSKITDGHITWILLPNDGPRSYGMSVRIPTENTSTVSNVEKLVWDNLISLFCEDGFKGDSNIKWNHINVKRTEIDMNVQTCLIQKHRTASTQGSRPVTCQHNPVGWHGFENKVSNS